MSDPTCANCAYEVDEVTSLGFCDNCQRAYDIGSRSDHCGDCGVCWHCHAEHQTSYCEGKGK